jgi:hypothetical protein
LCGTCTIFFFDGRTCFIYLCSMRQLHPFCTPFTHDFSLDPSFTLDLRPARVQSSARCSAPRVLPWRVRRTNQGQHIRRAVCEMISLL